MPRGGWRYGAGRPASNVKAEHCRRLDVRRLSRDGWLREGASCTWGWHANGESRGTVRMRAESDALMLTYSMNGTPIYQRLPLLRTACNFGGSRPWFACPRCERRVAVLCLSDGFNCRACSRVAYPSQSEDAVDRSWRRQQTIEAKLGDNWRRPKGMHFVTYDRLMSVIWRCEEEREADLYAYAHRRFRDLLDSETFDAEFAGHTAPSGSRIKRDIS